ncbi:MAG: VWA domain-containing protein, partial [Tagaea sp.]
WARRSLARSPTVLLVTDGLDREAGAGLAAEAERLAKSCGRLVWLNPLLRYEKFEPKSLGVKAILPHVDEFRPVHNLDSLEALIAALAQGRHARGRYVWKGQAA